MDNFISILRDSNSPEELEELKVQLFRENVRIKTDKADLEELRETVYKEKRELEESRIALEKGRKQFEAEADAVNKSVEETRKKLEEEMDFINRKQKVLDDGLKQLDIEKEKLEHEKEEFQKLKIKSSDAIRRAPVLEYRQGIFFKGITSEKGLKKRYKDLIKVFHPDNTTGDTYTLQNINREYETLLHDLKMKA